MACALALAGCGEGRKKVGDEGFVTGFVGGVAADEPRAAIVGRDILGRGGTAADAAAAGLGPLALSAYYAGAKPARGLVLGFCAFTPAEIEAAMTPLATIIRRHAADPDHHAKDPFHGRTTPSTG